LDGTRDGPFGLVNRNIVRKVEGSGETTSGKKRVGNRKKKLKENSLNTLTRKGGKTRPIVSLGAQLANKALKNDSGIQKTRTKKRDQTCTLERSRSVRRKVEETSFTQKKLWKITLSTTKEERRPEDGGDKRSLKKRGGETRCTVSGELRKWGLSSKSCNPKNARYNDGKARRRVRKREVLRQWREERRKKSKRILAE